MVIIEQYEFLLDSKVTFRLPENAIILDIKLLGGMGKKFVMWAIINTEAKLETRVFNIFTNKHQLEGGQLTWLKTIATGEGFVWHIFENKKTEDKQDSEKKSN